MRNKKIVIIAGIGIFLVALAAAGIVYSRQAPKKKTETKPKISEKQPSPELNFIASPLDGIKAEPELVKRQALAVMVENLDSIRPQAGIPQASLVVEALSEGGITRLMLVYLENGSGNIGPVRSARTHFVDMAKGLNALYAHVGGSDYALKAIKGFRVDDIDEFAYPSAFRRVPGLKAPHNVFTSTKALRQAKPEKNIEPPAFAFKKDLAEKNRPAGQKISINFSFPNYAVDWVYQPKTNSYLRSNGGKPHNDATSGKQLEAKNILIMFAPTTVIAGTPLLDVNTVGSGRLMVMRDGTVVNGTWSKFNVADPLTLNDELGGEIKLNPGQVWLEMVQPTTPVTVSGQQSGSQSPLQGTP